MLRNKLRSLLKQHGISTYRFAKAVKSTNQRSENWAYRLIRGEISLTMDSLELVIAVLSEMTNTAITVSDILSYSHSQLYEPQKLMNFVKQSSIATPLAIAPEGNINRNELVFTTNPSESILNYSFSVFHYKRKSMLIFENIAKNTLIPSKNILCPNVEYGWKVKTFGFSGWSSFSSTKRFIINSETIMEPKFLEPPSTPKAISPSGIVTELRPVLKVGKVSNATGYSFYIRNIVDDSVFDFEYVSKFPEFKIPVDILKDGGKYKWNSRAFNCVGFSTSYSKSLVFEVRL